MRIFARIRVVVVALTKTLVRNSVTIDFIVQRPGIELDTGAKPVHASKARTARIFNAILYGKGFDGSRRWACADTEGNSTIYLPVDPKVAEEAQEEADRITGWIATYSDLFRSAVCKLETAIKYKAGKRKLEREEATMTEKYRAFQEDLGRDLMLPWHIQPVLNELENSATQATDEAKRLVTLMIQGRKQNLREEGIHPMPREILQYAPGEYT